MTSDNPIQFFDFQKRSGREILSQNRRFITFHTRTQKPCRYRLAFCATITDELKERNTLRMRIAKNTLTGEWFFSFFEKDGLDLLTDNKGTKQSLIQNKDVCKFLSRELGWPLDETIRVEFSENMSTTPNTTTYKILGVIRTANDNTEE